jgi:hypothetical protein
VMSISPVATTVTFRSSRSIVYTNAIDLSIPPWPSTSTFCYG